MSLRTVLTAFGSVLERRKSSTPLRKALQEFARAVDPKTARQNFSAQQNTLTKLAQCMLTLESVASKENSKIIGGVCTLVSTALTQQVRAEARASDDDWRWLSRWPDMILECDAGGYDEAEALVRHLLESSWAELLSPVAVSALLERLKELPDAPEISSAKLMSLYEQYCIQHQAGEKATVRIGGKNVGVGPDNIKGVEKLEGVEKRRRNGKPGGIRTSERVDVRQEDASIAAEGAGLAADTAEVHDSEMDLPLVGYVPAHDVAENDVNSLLRAYADTNIFAITGTDMSVPLSSMPDTLVFDTSVVDTESETTRSDTAAYDVTVFDTEATGTALPNTTVIDVTATDTAAPDTTVIDTSVVDAMLLETTVIDPTLVDAPVIDATASTTAVRAEGESPDSIAPVVAGGINEDPPVDQDLTGIGDETVQSAATHRESTSEPMVQASNDDALTDDGSAGEGLLNNEPRDARPSTGALFPRISDCGDSRRVSKSNISNSRDVGTSGALLAHAGSPAGKSDLLVSVQLSLPGMKAPESVVLDETVVADGEQRLPEPDLDETAGSAAEMRPARDEATIDMFDDDHFEVESLGGTESAGDAEEVVVAYALKAPGIREQPDVREEPTEAVSSQRQKFNAFDGAALGDYLDGDDDQAINLDGFVLREDASTIINDDVAVADAFADVEKPGLLAGVQLPLIGSEYASKDATGTIEARDAENDDAAASATVGDPVAAVAGEERNESQPTLDDIFDAFDGAAFDDDCEDGAVSLDEFVLGEESPRTVDADVPAIGEFAEVEQPGLFASVHLPLIESEYARKDATGTGDAEDAAGSAAPGDLTATAVAVHMHSENIETGPALNDLFDAFDDVSLGDDIGDDAVNLGEFLLTDDATTTINDDAPAADEFADVEQPEKLASMQSSVSGSEDASKDTTSAGEARDAAGSAGQSLQKPAPADRKLSRVAMQIVEVLLAELPNVEVELAICSDVDQSCIIDRKVVGEALQRGTEVLERFGSAADSVGFVGLARIVDIACEHVRSVAQIESLSGTQIRLLAQFSNVVRAYFNAPHASESAQLLIDLAVNDGWASPATIDEPEALLSLLANPDLSAVDEDAPVRQQRVSLEDTSLVVPADVNRDLLDGLLQELPVQCEEFSAAIERLMHGTGEHEDILVAQRIAHTIKGSGNTVGIRGLAALTHNIEDILLVLAQEKRLPSQPLADMLMNAADRLQAMTESLLGMGPPPEDALEVLQCVLDWANMIDREGLPADDATPQSLPQLVRAPLMQPALSTPAPSDDVENAIPVPANEAKRSVVEEQNLNEAPKSDLDKKVDPELEALLRVPARLIDQLLTTAGESIILTGQLRDRVRRALADLNGMSLQFERQQQLGGELEKLIDIKDFSRLQAQNDVRFDALEMDQYNELHSTARQLVESATDAREMGHALVDHLSSLDEMLINQEDLNRDTQDTVLHTRMVSVKSVFARLQRAVRQTCRATAKQVELHLSGGETLMDSDALIRIVDPLMHLLRNAIDHGIEDAETRLRNGKAAIGNVYLDFQREGNDVVINCRDDGAGLNYDAIRHAAEERGLIGPDVSLDALKQIILRANFSTRAQASQVSGRGIGLDAVHNSVLTLGGTMTVESESGRGCDFQMRLPFNLISSHALLVRAGPNVVALASRGVTQIVHGSEGEMRRLGDKTVFQVGDDVYPATTLEAVIGDKEERRDSERRSRPVVLARTDGGVTAVSVESVIGSRDLVVKSLGKLLPKFRGVVGATILGDGHVAPVIDLPDILSNRDAGVDVGSAIATDSSTDSNSGFVLVVDDSLSARRALAQFMQDSGYRVRTARDGLEATKLLEGARPDLVLADLEMPRMNGIELTVHLRATAETADVPVIMITSRSTTKHRERAKSAGVNAYLTKPYSEDVLIEAVRGLIREQESKRRERPAA